MKPGTVTFRHLWWTARGGAALAAALVAVLALSGPAWAADGDLDTSFGDDFASDGTRDGFRLQNRTKLKDELRSLAFRSDGTFVAGGFDDNNGSIDEAQRMAWASLGTNGVGNGGFSNPHERPRGRCCFSPTAAPPWSGMPGPPPPAVAATTTAAP